MRPRVLFLGMFGAFSTPPLEALIRAGIEVAEVALPGAANRPIEPAAPAGGLPVLTPYATRGIVQVAWEHGIPVREVADLGGLAVPDVLAVACFDQLIPRSVWQRAGLAVNVHPSLLPDNRGPAPLFWTFRLERRTTGVTVHRLAERADAGDILAQREIPVPQGADGAALERDLARIGGELLVRVIGEWQRGELRPIPQDEARATNYGWPSAADWEPPSDWTPAQRERFARGTAHLR